MFKGNISKLLKQAQEMQQKLEQVQSQLSDIIIEADAGGGMVSVKVNGNQEILELDIDEEALNEDKELLEDLIISALNKGISKSKSDSQDKMNSITGGMMGGLKIPGQ
tara:strand:- start:110 stop:433 length:324 start_codon:yes stop_codon:yes gene_type:complete